jgi:hypothetical protein
LVKIKADKIKLNWEAQDYKWVSLKDAKKFKLLPGFKEVLDKISLLKIN